MLAVGCGGGGGCMAAAAAAKKREKKSLVTDPNTGRQLSCRSRCLIFGGGKKERGRGETQRQTEGEKVWERQQRRRLSIINHHIVGCRRRRNDGCFD